MKKWILISFVALLTGWKPACAAEVMTKDPSHLEFGQVKLEGSMTSDRSFRLSVMVTNTGEEDYADNSWPVALADDAGAYDAEAYAEDPYPLEAWPYPLDKPIIEIPAGETVEVCKLITVFEPGHYDLCALSQYIEPRTLFTFSVDIAERRSLNVTSSLQVDMLEQSGDDTFIYGDFEKFRLTGIATVKNEEDFPVFPNLAMAGGLSGAIVAAIPSSIYPVAPTPSIKQIAYELQPGQSVSVPFQLEFYNTIESILAAQEENYHGRFYVMVGTPWSGMENISMVAFHPKECTLTYWTADGHVSPLTVGADQTVRVPAEATAVDLRGVYRINTVFTIDASEANPNCLYFMNELDYVRGLDGSANVVRGYSASRIAVTDGYDFSTPMPFTSKTAWYMYPRPQVSADGATFTGTLTLPFQPTHIGLYDLNTGPMEVLHGENLGIYRCDAVEGNRLKMDAVNFQDVKAYEPYVLRLTIPSHVEFVAEDYAFLATATAVSQGCSVLTGTVRRLEAEADTYLYNPWLQRFCLSAEGDAVAPFRACLDGSRLDDGYDEYIVDFEDGGSTGVKSVVTAATGHRPSDAVYDLQGRLMGSGKLPKGLYIVNGKKVYVN